MNDIDPTTADLDEEEGRAGDNTGAGDVEVVVEVAEVDLIQVGLDSGVICLSEDGSRIRYVARGKEYSFHDPEEKIRAAAYVELIERYKYDPQDMDTEVAPPRREPKLPADIVVYQRGSDKAFMAVETKAEETEGKIDEARREGLGNAMLLDAKYLWLVCGTEKFAFNVTARLTCPRKLVHS